MIKEEKKACLLKLYFITMFALGFFIGQYFFSTVVQAQIRNTESTEEQIEVDIFDRQFLYHGENGKFRQEEEDCYIDVCFEVWEYQTPHNGNGYEIRYWRSDISGSLIERKIEAFGFESLGRSFDWAVYEDKRATST